MILFYDKDCRVTATEFIYGNIAILGNKTTHKLILLHFKKSYRSNRNQQASR